MYVARAEYLNRLANWAFLPILDYMYSTPPPRSGSVSNESVVPDSEVDQIRMLRPRRKRNTEKQRKRMADGADVKPDMSISLKLKDQDGTETVGSFIRYVVRRGYFMAQNAF
jgi:hypothetical protein